MTHLTDLLRDVPRVYPWHNDDAYIKEADVLAALSAAPVRVRVKPLEWEPSVIGKPWHSAKSPWGWYYAQWDDETQAWFASLEMGEIEAPIILDPSDVPTIEEAKAAAQRDYEARILAALEAADHVNETPKSEHDARDVLTPDPVDALVKALERIAADDEGDADLNEWGHAAVAQAALAAIRGEKP